jgi:hypothetical protein
VGPAISRVLIASLLAGCAVAVARSSSASSDEARETAAAPTDRSPLRAQAANDRAAVVLERDGVAASQVVALGRDLVVHGRAAAGAAVLGGSALVEGEVAGDLVVLGGDVALAPGARIGGDVFVLGGSIDARPGARVDGRAVAYPTAPGALLVLAEGPALGLSPWSAVVIGTKIALLAAWLVTAMVLVGTAWPALRSTAAAIEEQPLRSFATGLVAVLAMILAVIFLATFLGVAGGVPLLVVVALAALVLKLWGTVAVCAYAGERVLRRRAEHGVAGPLAATAIGLGLLGAMKFVPWVGVWVWTAATLAGVGAALRTKLGTRAPWFA